MNLKEVLAAMAMAPKGANIVCEWERNAKVRKTVSDDIKKHVRMVGRIGVQYDNLAAVQEKRENGTLPQENAGLAWGQYLVYPYVITHKDKEYLRLYKGTGGYPAQVTWTKNGVEVMKEDIAADLLASEKGESEGDCFCVQIDALIRVHTEVAENQSVESEKETVTEVFEDTFNKVV